MSLTLYPGVFSVSEEPRGGDSKDKVCQGIGTTRMLHTDRKYTNSSTVFNSISPTSGDGSDLGHYRAKIITLRLRMLSASGGLPGCVPVI